MSLPIIIIFERHWDTIPKLLVQDLLPSLAQRGYDTLCFEFPQDLTFHEIVARHKSGLDSDVDLQQQAEKLLKQVGITRNLSEVSFSQLVDLMKFYVSSKKYVEVAEKIKQLPASHILKDIFEEGSKLSISVKGIDVNSETFDKMVSVDLSTRMVGIRANEDYRIQTIFGNLLKLRDQQEEGVAFVCGAFHAAGLLAKFREQNMQNEVLYYFPHSPNRYEDSIDDIREVTMNDTLLEHTHLLRKQDVKPFKDRIIKEITEKTRYKKEVAEGNSHSQFLSECFKTNFRAFLRPGYHVDALLDFRDSPDIERIRKHTGEVGIQTDDISMNKQKYLVIPNVNTTEIADKLRTISPIVK